MLYPITFIFCVFFFLFEGKLHFLTASHNTLAEGTKVESCSPAGEFSGIVRAFVFLPEIGCDAALVSIDGNPECISTVSDSNNVEFRFQLSNLRHENLHLTPVVLNKTCFKFENNFDQHRGQIGEINVHCKCNNINWSQCFIINNLGESDFSTPGESGKILVLESAEQGVMEGIGMILGTIKCSLRSETGVTDKTKTVAGNLMLTLSQFRKRPYCNGQIQFI